MCLNCMQTSQRCVLVDKVSLMVVYTVCRVMDLLSLKKGVKTKFYVYVCMILSRV